MFWGLVDIYGAFTLFDYEAGGILSRVVHDIKYHGRSDLAEQMGVMLGKALSPHLAVQPLTTHPIDVIVPVPLTKERFRERGYNQSEHIARGISTVLGIPVCTTALERVTFQGSQTQLNAMERRDNVEHAFRLTDGSAVADKHVLLVDDVMTTGATLKACALLLDSVEGTKVSIITLAVTKY